MTRMEPKAHPWEKCADDPGGMSHRDAGTYAQSRYQTGLRNYRRRMRPYYIGLIAIGFAAYMIVWATRGIEWWSFAIGAASGCLFCLATWTRDEPPEFIAKWGRGAEGERKTARAITPLLEGWKVRHDVDIGRGNVDHLLLDPAGTGYLLETKTLAGQISVESGTLTCRYVDDPDEVRRYPLQERMSALVDRVSAEWSRRTGREAPEIRALVVIWGSFSQRQVETRSVAYIAGEELHVYLKNQGPARFGVADSLLAPGANQPS